MEKDVRFKADELIEFASALLSRAGLPDKRSVIVARTLVEADLMGHTTHGLNLLPLYLNDIGSGKMKKEGEPEVISDRGSVVTWDGHYLPGIWLMHKAIDLALERIHDHPVMTIVMRRSHHIGCLAAYMERATIKGLMMLLSCSDPRSKTVAPFGGLDAVYSPNPIAAGIPTEEKPIIIDISTSVTANGLVMRTLEEGKKLPHPWLLDKNGKPTDDPSTFVTTPPSTVLPLGGLDAGYKGYGLGLMVEALTSGLAGYGRADNPDTWGASVFLQLINPEAFSGIQSFERQNQYVTNACRKSQPVDKSVPVRVPGDRAFQFRDEQRYKGVLLYPSIVPALQACAEKYGINMPEHVSD